MSAVDAPPGVEFAGAAAGEFEARPAARRRAKAIFYYVFAVAVLTWTLAWRRKFQPGVEILLAAPVLFLGVAAVGYAVRAARLRIDRDGVRWGWSQYGFRMGTDRLARAIVYDDAVAMVSRRGGAWYVAARDWARFDDLAERLRQSALPTERVRRRAPWRARFQAFGLTLDALLFADATGATIALAIALAL